MTNTIITTEAINAAADACWQIDGDLKSKLQSNSNAYVHIKSGGLREGVAEAFGHCGIDTQVEKGRRLRRLFRRELAKQIAA